MNVKKLLAALTALLTVLPMIVSCSDSGNTDNTGDTSAAQDTTSVQEAETTVKLTPDLPEKDFGGAAFTFLTSGPADSNGSPWETYDFYVAEEDGDVINDAVFARNMHVNETYNVVIGEIKSEAGTYDAAQQAILAGEDIYDTVVTNFKSASKLAQTGQTIDMYTIPHIDLTQPWWDVNLVESLSIGGKVHFATGDITVMDNDAIWVLMFNKHMLDDFGLDSIYEMVNSDSWYIDKMAEMAGAVTADLNGDGAMTWEEDRFGISTGPFTGSTTLYSSGLSLVSKDKDDLPYFNLNTDRATLVAEKMGALLSSDAALISNWPVIKPADLQTVFMDGRSLFYGEVLMYITLMRSSETDFGVVPWPKLDETQEDYSHVTINTAGKCVTVPMTQTDLEYAGIILEAMAAEAMYTMTPAYYEISLNTKYMRDNESVQMLEIILGSMRMDLAFIYDWGGLTTALQTSIKDNDGKFMSVLDSNLEKFNSEMEAAVAEFTSK